MSVELPRGTLYSPPQDNAPVTPTWTRGRRNRSGSTSSVNVTTATSDVWGTIWKLKKFAKNYWKKLTLAQKIIGVTLIVVVHALMLVALIYHEALFHWFTPIAKKWRELPGGFLILFFWTWCSAFPPLIGYSTSVTLAGFIYGVPNGWYIAALGTTIGSTSAFIACRLYFRAFAQKMVQTDKRFAALSLTLKHDGLKLLCMIRLCPLPYSISNAALSTFPTVSPLNFMIATAVATPKLFIHVFIGSQMAALGESGEKMDGKTKALNYASMAFGAILGVVTGLIIYRRTIRRAKQLEAEERRRAREGVETPNVNDTEGDGYFDDPIEAEAERTLSNESNQAFLDEEGQKIKKQGLAGRALSAFNELMGRTAEDSGVDTDTEEEGRLLDGDEDTDDEDAEELLVVEDGVMELEEGSRRPGPNNSRSIRH